MNVHTEEYEVTQDDLDDLNHVNNVRYVQWVQEISKNHWYGVTTPEMQKSLIWVVKNHNITYHRPALLGDSLELRTYIKSNQGPITTRIVEIKNNKTGQPIVSAITEWCLLDAQTLRPKRVPDSVKDLFKTK